MIEVGMDTHNPLNMRKFKRVQKLQLRGYNVRRGIDRGWRMGLPTGLRVLHIEMDEVTPFHGEPASSNSLTHQAARCQMHLVMPDACSDVPSVACVPFTRPCLRLH